MTSPEETRTGQDEAGEAAKTRAALRRYQVMAFVTGCWLLLLSTEMVLKYIVQVNGTAPVIGSWVGIVHGWVYMIYLVCCFLFWSQAGWKPGRLILMVIGGVIPFLSFIVEWQVTRWYRAEEDPVAP